MYALRHKVTGKYVTNGGRETSYVVNLDEARLFRTKEEAAQEMCVDSEYIEQVYRYMGRPQPNT